MKIIEINNYFKKFFLKIKNSFNHFLNLEDLKKFYK